MRTMTFRLAMGRLAMGRLAVGRLAVGRLAMATVCAAASSGWSGQVAAQDAVIVRENPTECEVAAALGVNKTGCPPLGQAAVPGRKPATRGLSIGTIDEMPEPPPPPPPAPQPSALPAPVPPPVVQKPVVATTIPAPVPAPVAQLPPRPEARAEHKASFRITFAFASAELAGNAFQVLDLIGAAMTAPDAGAARFRIVGHTDAVGSAEINQKLSEDRANAVKVYLIRKFGIASERLEASGRGARDLLKPEDPAAADNRRVEITNLGG